MGADPARLARRGPTAARDMPDKWNQAQQVMSTVWTLTCRSSYRCAHDPAQPTHCLRAQFLSVSTRMRSGWSCARSGSSRHQDQSSTMTGHHACVWLVQDRATPSSSRWCQQAERLEPSQPHRLTHACALAPRLSGLFFHRLLAAQDAFLMTEKVSELVPHSPSTRPRACCWRSWRGGAREP